MPAHALQTNILTLNGPRDLVVHHAADKVSQAFHNVRLQRHVALHALPSCLRNGYAAILPDVYDDKPCGKASQSGNAPNDNSFE